MQAQQLKIEYMNLYTPEEKKEWWDEGEWIDEADEINFQYLGFDCKICRIAAQEPLYKEICIFGGHLCGYICIPEDHPDFKNKYSNIDMDVHGGLTFGAINDEKHWIGFDCGHSNDIVPSMEYLKTNRLEVDNLMQMFPRIDISIFKRTYKNIQFCISECMHMAEQLNQRKG